LPYLNEPPAVLEEGVFTQLFDVAAIANFSLAERDSYEDA
jgi:hypothetical protein